MVEDTSKREQFGRYLDRWSHECGHEQFAFFCPGCECTHIYTTKNTNNPDMVWTFNYNRDSPTFQPSLLCNPQRPESRCHLFVTEGKIIFLGDCWHKLAGQTVSMVEVD